MTPQQYTRLYLITFFVVLLACLLMVAQSKAQSPPESLAALDSIGTNPWVPRTVRVDSATGLGWATYVLAGTLIEADVFFPHDSLRNGMLMYNAFYPDTVWVRTPFANDYPLRGPTPAAPPGLPGDTLIAFPAHVWEGLRLQFLVADTLFTRYPR